MQKLSSVRPLLALLSGSLLSASGAGAAIIVDDFSVDQAAVTQPSNGGFSNTAVNGPTSNIIGGNRTWFLQTFGSGSDVTQGVSGGAFHLSKPDSCTAFADLQWGRNGELPSADLTEGGINDRFELLVTTNGPFQLVLIARSNGMGIPPFSKLTFNIPAGFSHMYIPFASMPVSPGHPAPANFTDINFIDLSVNGFDGFGGTELSFDRLRAIPASGGTALLGLGMVMLMRRRRA